MSVQKKFVTNINWGKNIDGIRQIELYDFYTQPSSVSLKNPTALSGNAVGGITPTSRYLSGKIDLFLVRKRTIRLFELWNRITNSGLFNISTSILNSIKSLRNCSSSANSNIAEFLLKDLDNASYDYLNLTITTEKVFYRMITFLNASVLNYNEFMTTGITNKTYYDLTKSGHGYVPGMVLHINASFNPTSEKFVSLMNELIDILKSLLDNTKLLDILSLSIDDLNFDTEIGRNGLLSVYTKRLNYNSIAKIDKSYLKANIIPSDETLLYPQFCSEITKSSDEVWSTRNVMLNTSNKEANDSFIPSKILCSKLEMVKPLLITNPQFINWENPDDEPYIMVYNGAGLIYIPEEIKTLPEPIIHSYYNYGEFVLGSTNVQLPSTKIISNSKVRGFEFTVNTTSTGYTTGSRKVLGLLNKYNVIGEGLFIYSDATGDKVAWVYSGKASGTLCTGHRDKAIKVKIINTDSGSELYVDDILINSSASVYNFNLDWELYSQTPGLVITNFTYLYENLTTTPEPDNSENLAGKFWKIGTSDTTDTKYNKHDDIKLNLNIPLMDLKKFDYFDNLTLYMKLD